MKIDFNKPILDLSGKPVKQDDSAKSANATLGTVAVNALMAAYRDEDSLSGADKARRYALALKINKGGTVDLKSEDVTTIKTLIGKAFNPLIVGRAYEIIDPGTE